MPKKKPLTAEEFIRLWQTAVSLKEFASKSGVSQRIASERAYTYRRKGIPLKKFPAIGGGRKKLDLESLADLARSLAPKEETE